MSWDIRSFFIFCSLTAILILGSLTIFSVTSIDISYFLRFLLISIFSILIVTGVFYTVNLNRILSFGWVVLVLNILLILSVELFGKEINGSKKVVRFWISKFTALRIYENFICAFCNTVPQVF